MGSQLVLGRDAGGQRHFLDGRPISCGSGLELALRLHGKEVWTWARFELEWGPEGPSPAFYIPLHLGDRFEAIELDGQWGIFDRKLDRVVDCQAREPATADGEEGWRVWTELDHDRWRTRYDAERAAQDLDLCMNRIAVKLVMSEGELALARFRWPRSS